MARRHETRFIAKEVHYSAFVKVELDREELAILLECMSFEAQQGGPRGDRWLALYNMLSDTEKYLRIMSDPNHDGELPIDD